MHFALSHAITSIPTYATMQIARGVHTQPRPAILCDMTHAHTRPGRLERNGHLPTCTQSSPLKYGTNLSYPACTSLRHLPSPPYPRTRAALLAVTLRHIHSVSSHFLSVVSSIQKHRKVLTIKIADNLEFFLQS